MSQFDADALERAAKAARELEKSKNVRALMEMSKREHSAKMEAEKTKQKEAETARVAHMKDMERVKWEEQRKTIKMNSDEQMRLEEYRKRQKNELQDREHEMQRQRNQEMVRLQTQEEMRRQEMRRATEQEIQEERRRTDEHRAALERQNLRERALAEAEGRIKEQRENEDVIARQIALKGEQDRKRVKEQMAAFFTGLGETATGFITDTSKVTTTVVGLTALAAGVYATRESARVAGRYVERLINTPPLVRETSRATGVRGLTASMSRLLGMRKDVDFSDVVLNPALDTRVHELGTSTANAKRNNAPYRHMLFYGPPGTGKTMVAKRLARTSGLDYAIMSGGDVGPLGKDAVTELHKLFDWSETSRRGLLVFIDEADAFLSSRSRQSMSEEQRNALNAVLYRTGEESRKFMMVMATNRPGDLDDALTDRVDDALLFDLPGLEERKALVRQYFDMYIRRAGEGSGFLGSRASAQITVEDSIDESVLDSIAEATEGFSGRGISKLMVSVQGAVYGREVPSLTKELLDEVLGYKIKEMKERKDGFGGLEYS
jgi:ATPase family AAA domain-containing protein 3A/B